ncbi:MAG: trypsin-like peptidase domain-containing protein [Chitinophagaceae bacterium]|nr:trypsin-like peptidase domain-containing protein [Chitinophagaceae bacterium]
MDDILLLDAIERYKNGEMTAQERTFFEELRKNNPEIDQLAVEHMFFLQELENTANIKAYKLSLNEVENKLVSEGVITKKQLKGKAKVIYMWNRYRRTIAVAASIAGIVSLFTAGLLSEYNKNKSAEVITPLVDYKFKQVDAKLKQFERKLNQAAVITTPPSNARPKFEANFRATGFLIDVNGYIVTNAHVINNAKNLIVENKKGDQFYAKPVYVSNSNDLAILKINDTSFKKFTVLPYSIRRLSAELGEHIFTLGYPRDEVVYGEGYLSAKSGFSGDTSSYQISISVNPGNSGGPVINKNGEVIGIISSKETNADGVVFAIKSKNIYNALEEIKKDEAIKLPLTGTIKGLDRVQQIKKIEDCVFMVKGN